MDIARLKKGGVYDSIVSQIQQLINDGTLSPGDQLLPERQLAEKMGVSRATVREALRALASKGLIEITPGSGACVREVNLKRLIEPLASAMLNERKNVHDLLEARTILEVGVARLAAQRADETDLYQIREAALEIEENVRKLEAADEADVSFHELLAQASHNAVVVNLMSVVSSLLKEVYAPSRRKLLENPESRETYRRQNQELYEAVRDHDGERAAEVMTEHFATVADELVRLESDRLR